MKKREKYSTGAMDRLMDVVWPKHSTEKGGTEHLVMCPHCFHEGRKCSVNTSLRLYQCFHCGAKGTVRGLLNHLKVMGKIKHSDIQGVYNGKRHVSSRIQALDEGDKKVEHIWTELEPCIIPDAFVPLSSIMGESFTREGKLAKKAVRYLKSRGLEEWVIEDYDIHFGVGVGSRYSNHLLFPVHDVFGRQVVFWTTRSIMPGASPKSMHASQYWSKRGSRDVLFRACSMREGCPVVITEGPFDAMTVEQVMRYPAVALFGKVLHQHHVNLINRVNPSVIYVCLDSDADSKYSKRIVDTFDVHGREVRVVDLKKGDPNDLPPEDLQACFSASDTTPISYWSSPYS